MSLKSKMGAGEYIHLVFAIRKYLSVGEAKAFMELEKHACKRPDHADKCFLMQKSMIELALFRKKYGGNKMTITEIVANLTR